MNTCLNFGCKVDENLGRHNKWVNDIIMKTCDKFQRKYHYGILAVVDF